jgi:tolkin protein
LNISQLNQHSVNRNEVNGKLNKTSAEIIAMRNFDRNKIQSNTKDIIVDNSDNIILSSSKKISTVTSAPVVRSTLPNRFSNSGGNGGSLDDIEILSPDKSVRKRHRNRRQGR